MSQHNKDLIGTRNQRWRSEKRGRKNGTPRHTRKIPRHDLDMISFRQDKDKLEQRLVTREQRQYWYRIKVERGLMVLQK